MSHTADCPLGGSTHVPQGAADRAVLSEAGGLMCVACACCVSVKHFGSFQIPNFEQKGAGSVEGKAPSGLVLSLCRQLEA